MGIREDIAEQEGTADGGIPKPVSGAKAEVGDTSVKPRQGPLYQFFRGKHGEPNYWSARTFIALATFLVSLATLLLILCKPKPILVAIIQHENWYLPKYMNSQIVNANAHTNIGTLLDANDINSMYSIRLKNNGSLRANIVVVLVPETCGAVIKDSTGTVIKKFKAGEQVRMDYLSANAYYDLLCWSAANPNRPLAKKIVADTQEGKFHAVSKTPPSWLPWQIEYRLTHPYRSGLIIFLGIVAMVVSKTFIRRHA